MVEGRGLADGSGKRSEHDRAFAAVKHSILEGRYEGRLLPSYRQLAHELNVSLARVQRVMAELEREGLIRREEGRGVLPRPQRRLATAKKSLPLQCISFLQYSFTVLPSFVASDYLAGYTDVLDYLEIRMRFLASDELDSGHTRLLSPILPIEAQGVVLINSCPSELMKWLQVNNVPFVVQYFSCYASEGLPTHSSIYVNKTGGAFKATNYLLELGHHNIGFMGPGNPNEPPENRGFEGYRAALACAGLRYSTNNIAYCATREGHKSFAIAKDLLRHPQRPTGVLASSDKFAVSLYDAAQELGLRVPEDLSIVGFDNEPISERTDLSLTTVSVPRRELARGAVELLLEAAENPRAQPKTRILDTHLIIRGTTAPPRAMQ